MELTITKQDLLRGLNRTHAVADRKSSMPILSNVLLAAESDGSLRFAATDLYLSETARPHLRANDAVASIEGTEPLTRSDLEAFWRHCGADPDRTTDFDTAYVASNGRRFRVNLNLHLGRLGAHRVQYLVAIGLIGCPERRAGGLGKGAKALGDVPAALLGHPSPFM